jgi:hypothetical protein
MKRKPWLVCLRRRLDKSEQWPLCFNIGFIPTAGFAGIMRCRSDKGQKARIRFINFPYVDIAGLLFWTLCPMQIFQRAQPRQPLICIVQRQKLGSQHILLASELLQLHYQGESRNRYYWSHSQPPTVSPPSTSNWVRLRSASHEQRPATL